MIKLKNLLKENALQWKRIKRPEDLQIEYRAKTASGNTFVVSRGGTTKRVAHPLTHVMRNVPVRYWVARMEDPQGHTSPEFYDAKAKSLNAAKAKADRFAKYKGLI
jgi:hypothetical protein